MCLSFFTHLCASLLAWDRNQQSTQALLSPDFVFFFCISFLPSPKHPFSLVFTFVPSVSLPPFPPNRRGINMFLICGRAFLLCILIRLYWPFNFQREDEREGEREREDREGKKQLICFSCLEMIKNELSSVPRQRTYNSTLRIQIKTVQSINN